MKRQDVRKYQLFQLALLKKYDKICNKLGLSYYLVFGTLIGAIRHKGFIPWDADIDVAMFRKDYEILKDYFLQQPEEKLFYQHYLTEKNHIFSHALLRIKNTHVIYNSRRSRYPFQHDGVFIDIFPIDVVSDNEKLLIKQIQEISRLERIILLKAAPTYGEKTSTFKRICKETISMGLAPFSFLKLNQDADELMKRYNSDTNTQRLGVLTAPQIYKRLLFPRECFGTPRKVIFEGEEFPAPNQAEKFLSISYGDFMTLPPEKERWNYLDSVIEEIDYGNYLSPDEL